jgi:hypothetical protein
VKNRKSLRMTLRKKPSLRKQSSLRSNTSSGDSGIGTSTNNTVIATTGSSGGDDDRVIAERIQIYERLSSGYISDPMLDNYLLRFTIIPSTGLRKVALAECLCKLYD